MLKSFTTSAEELIYRFEIENNQLEKIPMNSTSSIVFAKGTAGFLLHEILGHLLEGDFVGHPWSVIGRTLLKGDQIATPDFNAVDDIRGYQANIGLNKIDDEGQNIKPVSLIKEGRLSDYLCDISSGKRLNLKSNGCGRRENYKKDILPRMRSTFIKPLVNGKKKNEIIARIDNGYIVERVLGGNVNPINGDFQLICDHGSRIKEGTVDCRISNFIVSGNIYTTLKNIIDIGSDFFFYPVFCHKNNQNIPVCVGSPTLSIDQMNIGDLTYG